MMVDLVKWEPFREMISLREAMDRLFEDSFLRPGWFGLSAGPADVLPLDIYETDDRLVVKATVPGIKPDDIEVTITGDLLTIKGEFKTEEKTEHRNYLRQERRGGSFCRQINLPGGLDSDKVEASFEQGVLTLQMPKVPSSQAKTVKVVTK